MKIVNFNSDPCQSFGLTVRDSQGNASACMIDARWNTRMFDGAGGWSWDLTGSDGTVLLAGVSLVLGIDMLAPYGLDMGGMFAFDTSGANQEAGLNDLGSRVLVAWLAPDEVAALTAALGLAL
jgi:hypothetical protein